jgi:hypothetical protein
LKVRCEEVRKCRWQPNCLRRCIDGNRKETGTEETQGTEGKERLWERRRQRIELERRRHIE